MKKLVA